MAGKRTLRTIPPERTHPVEQDPKVRACNFKEVTHVFSIEQAVHESERCLFCPDPACVEGCPVSIDIPGFIRKIGERDFQGAYGVISQSNRLASVCGRVCPQESQCEGPCPVGTQFEPVAIGRLERFVGDMAIEQKWSSTPYIEKNGLRV